MLSLANKGATGLGAVGAALAAANGLAKVAGTVGANARASAAAWVSGPDTGCVSPGGMVSGMVSPASLPDCLLFHHCCDIWASISSIFLSVTARSSGEAMLLWKNEGRLLASSVRWPCSTSRWRSLRS